MLTIDQLNALKIGDLVRVTNVYPKLPKKRRTVIRDEPLVEMNSERWKGKIVLGDNILRSVYGMWDERLSLPETKE